MWFIFHQIFKLERMRKEKSKDGRIVGGGGKADHFVRPHKKDFWLEN